MKNRAEKAVNFAWKLDSTPRINALYVVKNSATEDKLSPLINQMVLHLVFKLT